MPADGRHALRVAAAVLAAAALAAATGCSGSSGDSLRGEGVRDGFEALLASVDPGSPVLSPADGYAGSARCIGCHGDVFDFYRRTSHAVGLRTAGRPGVSGAPVAADADRNGRDDFRDGLDLATVPAFAALGTAAPRLSFAKGEERPWRFSIGGATFPVAQVYGGSHREAYLVQVGRSLYPAPMEYDVDGRRWVAGDLGTWYAGTTPLFANPAAAAAGIDRSASAERRCSGCHQNGFTVAFDAPSGEWLSGYTELGVGCESCHGPAAAHVLSGGDPSLVVNPRRFLDGSPEGARLADDTCGRCHTRGEGAVLPGSPAPLLHPWSNAFGRPFRPGDEARFFIAPSSDPADHWGYRDNFLSPVPTPGDPSDDSFVAARRGWMQAVEQASGAHAPSVAGSARCFDCHAPHGPRGVSGVASTSDRVPGARLSAEDGSLCLSCHAGSGPFAGIAAADVTAFTRGKASGVPDAVVDHMKDVGMPVARADFRPKKTGVGRCTTCHMVSTSTEPRSPGTDPGGFTSGGPHGGTHTGLVIWPSVSARTGVTNSCNACHPTGTGDAVGRILDEWATGDPDGDGIFHGYTPRGEHLGNLNAASGSGRRCAECHTTAGFRGIAVEGDASGLSTDDDRLAAIVARAARRDEGITCAACHGRDGSGQFAAGPNPLRLPKRDLCGSCHTGAGITFAHYTTLGTPVHYPQKELFEGTAGVEPPGTGTWPGNGHTFLADGCVSCHFDAATPGGTPSHSFQPAARSCQNCHGSVSTVDIPAFADFDGSGSAGTVQQETAGLLALLKAAILSGDPAVAFDGSGFRRNGVPGLPGASAARQRAAYNWEVVSKDGSLGLHNAHRSIRLLQQSYRELTGVNVPGAFMR